MHWKDSPMSTSSFSCEHCKNQWAKSTRTLWISSIISSTRLKDQFFLAYSRCSINEKSVKAKQNLLPLVNWKKFFFCFSHVYYDPIFSLFFLPFPPPPWFHHPWASLHPWTMAGHTSVGTKWLVPAGVLAASHSPGQLGCDGQSSLVTNGLSVPLTWWGQLITGRRSFCIYIAKSSPDLPLEAGRPKL